MEALNEHDRWEHGVLSHDLALALVVAAIQLIEQDIEQDEIATL